MKIIWALSVFIVSVVCVSIVEASEISVQPLIIRMHKELNQIKKIVVKNSSEKEVLIQVDIHKWTQKNNEDLLERSQDLLISPRVFELAGKAEQVVRLAYQAQSDNLREKAFRLIVREIPDPLTEPSNGINVLLQLSIPIFVNTENEGISGKSWMTAHIEHRDKVYFMLVNNSPQHLRLTGISLVKTGENANDQQIFQTKQLKYIFPGMTEEWNIGSIDIDNEYSYLANIIVNNNEIQIPIISN